jgi:hypothetical protein
MITTAASPAMGLPILRQAQIFAMLRGSRQAALEQKIALVSAEKLTS